VNIPLSHWALPEELASRADSDHFYSDWPKDMLRRLNGQLHHGECAGHSCAVPTSRCHSHERTIEVIPRREVSTKQRMSWRTRSALRTNVRRGCGRTSTRHDRGGVVTARESERTTGITAWWRLPRSAAIALAQRQVFATDKLTQRVPNMQFVNQTLRWRKQLSSQVFIPWHRPDGATSTGTRGRSTSMMSTIGSASAAGDLRDIGPAGVRGTQGTRAGAIRLAEQY